MSLECTRYKKMERGNLLGFADLYVPKWGVEINGFTHNRKGNQEWVNMPSKEYTKPDGTKGYAPIVKFKDQNHQKAFLNACLEACKKKSLEESNEVTTNSIEVEIPF